MYDDITDIYDQIFPLNRGFMNFIPAYLGKPGSRVLDLGCGPGDYVDHLTRTGYIATGIDSSARMIEHAKAHNQGSFFQLSFTEIDQMEGGFDCIFSIGNSLSYLLADLVMPFFQGVYRLLNPAGYFVMQVVNWDKYRSTGTMDFDVKTLSDGRTFHREYQPTPEGALIFHTEIRKNGEIQNSWSDQLHPKLANDLVREIQESDLKAVNVFGDFQPAPFDPISSPATILVAQRSTGESQL